MSKAKREAAKRNAQIWADTHYENTGHHGFVLQVTEVTQMDVARVRDAQLELPDSGTIPFGPSTFGETP